jgi:glycosyltransferase involved in cell wall biosynthesis
MEEGHTGFIVEGLEGAVEAARRIPKLSRKRCREVFERRFTAARMANDYLRVYERLINRKQNEPLEARA